MSDREKTSYSVPLVELKGVVKSFRTPAGHTVMANNGIDLEIFSGETIGIVGESGCGKSTLAKLMVHLEEPSSGKILFQGKDISSLKKILTAICDEIFR